MCQQQQAPRWRSVRWFLPIHRRSRMWILVAISQTLVATALIATLLVNQRLQNGFVLKAAEFIAADARLDHPDLDIEALGRLAERLNVRFAYTRTMMTSVLSEDGELHLTNLKAVDSLYPLRGELQLSTSGDRPHTSAPSADKIWVDSILASKGISLGQRLRIGDLWFEVDAFIVREPDRAFVGPGSMARVMISHDDLQRSGLVRPNSRIQKMALLAGDESDIDNFLEQAPLPEVVKAVRAREGGRIDVRQIVNNISLFVHLAGFVAMLFSAIVLFLALQLLETEERRQQRLLWHWGHSFSQRCTWFYWRLGLVAIATNVIGVLLSWSIQEYVANKYLRGLFVDLPALEWGGIWQALLLSLAVLPIAALSLWHCIKRPWLNSAERGYAMHALSWVALASITAVFFASKINNNYLMAGLLVSVALSISLYWLFIRLILARLPWRSSFWNLLKTNLSSRPRLNMLQTCSLSLVMMIAMSVFLLYQGMLINVEKSLAPDSPNHYLLSIQPDEIEQLGADLSSGLSMAEAPLFYPLVRGRVIRRNGIDIDPDASEGRERARLLREWALSYIPDSPNPIIAGSWFAPASADSGIPVDSDASASWSVSTEIVDTLDLKLGDELTFAVSGAGEYTGYVSSIRKVNWTTIKPNFFVLASPGLLSGVPTTYMTALRLDEGQSQLVSAIAAEYPGLTHLDLNLIIGRFQELIAIFLELMWSVLIYVCVLASVALGCILQFKVETSRRESILFKSFGVPDSLLRRVHLVENLLLSALAVLPAALISGVSSYYFYTSLLQLSFFGDLFDDITVLSLFAIGVVAVMTLIIERLVSHRRQMTNLRGAVDYHS